MGCMYILTFLLAMCGVVVMVAGQAYPESMWVEYFWPGAGLAGCGGGLFVGLIVFFND